MQLCNDSAVFNVLGMDAAGLDTYTRVTVKCSFYRESTSSMTDKGLKSSYKATIRIPAQNVPAALALTKGITVEHGVDKMTVLGWTDNRRAPHAPHIKVVCG